MRRAVLLALFLCVLGLPERVAYLLAVALTIAAAIVGFILIDRLVPGGSHDDRRPRDAS